jgi:hypothetical protein
MPESKSKKTTGPWKTTKSYKDNRYLFAFADQKEWTMFSGGHGNLWLIAERLDAPGHGLIAPDAVGKAVFLR